MVSKHARLTGRSQSVVEEAVKRMMYNIKPSGTLPDTILGSTPISEITLDPAPMEALVDTGSPIRSFQFLGTVRTECGIEYSLGRVQSRLWARVRVVT